MKFIKITNDTIINVDAIQAITCANHMGLTRIYLYGGQSITSNFDFSELEKLIEEADDGVVKE